MISISRYYAQGNVSQDQYIQFIRHDTLGFEYLDQSKNFAPQVILFKVRFSLSVNVFPIKEWAHLYDMFRSEKTMKRSKEKPIFH